MEINQTITIAGAKGGVGKTTTSINVGAAAAADGLRVVVVELDLAMANTLDFISFPDGGPEQTLHDVLADKAAIQEAIYEVDEDFYISPSGTDLDGYSDIDFDRLPAVLNSLKDEFDLVIVDTGAGLSRATVEPLRLADATVLVSTPRVAAIRDVNKTKTLAQRVGTPVCGLVLTKSGTGASPGPDRIAEFLDVSLLGHVPQDSSIPSSQDQGVPVIQSAPDSKAAQKYRTVTGNLLFRLDTGGHRDDVTTPDEVNVMPDDEDPLSVAAAVSVDADQAVADGRGSTVTPDGPTHREPSHDDQTAEETAPRDDMFDSDQGSGEDSSGLTTPDTAPASESSTANESGKEETDADGRSASGDTDSSAEESSSVLSRFVSVFR